MQKTREEIRFSVTEKIGAHSDISPGGIGLRLVEVARNQLEVVQRCDCLWPEVFYNTARYYQAYYGHKTDPRAVLVGLLLILSGFQYLNQHTRYNQAVAMVRKTPAYKNRLRALELERSGGTTNKKKNQKQQMDKKVEEELGKELELQITGAEKPLVWNLIGVRFLLLPYTILKVSLWYSCWIWRYRMKKAPFSWDDAAYLTRRALGLPIESWSRIDEPTKEDLVHKRLWEKANLESYLTEMRKESKRRR
ncbi:hypothetical protein MLD38_012114 [Melastoma candidum]|uniref:Uncharacterized protein n=1 Tax=Melastoma candidum TaxID=119954 RepID=A0ACB9R4P2_9MYRT|nr:hypothetical protein MLD38_012114 [Melastoma candidum]